MSHYPNARGVVRNADRHSAVTVEVKMQSQEIKSNFTRLLSPAGESENQQDSERREASRRRGIKKKKAWESVGSILECAEAYADRHGRADR